MEQSDKIILPKSALDHLMRFNTSDRLSPMTFRLNKTGSYTTVYCGVIEFTADEKKMYVPNWIMETLFINQGERVSITSVTLPKGSYLKLKPRNERFLKLQNPKNILEHHLKRYTTLYLGQTLRINYLNCIWEIDVVETKPTEAICINNADVRLDFESDEQVEANVDEESISTQADNGRLIFGGKQTDPVAIPKKPYKVTDHAKSAGYKDKGSYWDRLGSGKNLK